MRPELSLDWDEEMATARPHDCVSVPSNHPLYVLYTSGTTGTPKVITFLLEKMVSNKNQYIHRLTDAM